MIYVRLWFLPWTAGSTVRLMASTSPSGQPSRKQSVTSKSKWPGFTTRLVLLQPRASTLSFIRLGERGTIMFMLKTVNEPNSCWDQNAVALVMFGFIFAGSTGLILPFNHFHAESGPAAVPECCFYVLVLVVVTQTERSSPHTTFPGQTTLAAA